MSTDLRQTPATERRMEVARRTRVRSVVVSTGLVGLMVATGFAMLAIVPLGFVVRGVVRDRGLRDVRPWVAVLVTCYLTPLALWAALPDRERSLSRDMHPAFVPVIVAAALAVLVAVALGRRRIDPTTNEES